MEESCFSYKTASKERQQASETSHIFLYTAGYTTSLMLCPCPSIPPKFSLVSGQHINPNWCYWRWPTHHWTTTCWGGGCTKVHGTTVAPCPYVHQGDAAACPQMLVAKTTFIYAINESTPPSGIIKNFLLHYIVFPKVQRTLVASFMTSMH